MKHSADLIPGTVTLVGGGPGDPGLVTVAGLQAVQQADVILYDDLVAPEILDYRYQQDMLDKMEGVSGSLPQIVRVGGESEGVDYLQIARQLVGGQSSQLFSADDMEAIRARQADIAERVAERESEIAELLQAPEETEVEILPVTETQTDAAGEQRLDEIRQSVTEEIDLPGEGEEPPPPPPGTNPPVPPAPPAVDEPAPPAPRVTPAPQVTINDMSEGERSE